MSLLTGKTCDQYSAFSFHECGMLLVIHLVSTENLMGKRLYSLHSSVVCPIQHIPEAF